ncbi:nucleoside-diphosphate kinase [Tindallia californiensis]|uniref:Nucleoside diphosphate kinase n=1 Tax=Tindallia californiensis TaxID=159292 RepID=A0A1H3IT46_9FIRM|nr:nucleoside-diphosphate kinase [Tindallia californiensis]SDY30308.1 nucleoside diphosphate kinase [Tindallia californiensis]
MQKTLVLIKPQAVKKGLSGQIISRYEEKGLNLTALKMVNPTRKQLEKHYEEHEGKIFYHSLVETMLSGPVVALMLEGKEAVVAVRSLNGATDPIQAAPGSIRGDYGLEIEHNVVHGADSIDSAKREISIWFPEYEA